ncbi:MAG: hypothetical protein NXI07_09410, partial [bacterium]|nr:hypothetical protein [bacterium]
MRATRLIVQTCATLFLLLSTSIVGCGSTQTTGGGDRPGIGASEAVGAVDERYRRAGGSDGENVFRQIDWGTP